jgi:hypothetical protein
VVRQGKGSKRREVGLDDWDFQQIRPWLARRLEMPRGTLPRSSGLRRRALEAQ